MAGFRKWIRSLALAATVLLTVWPTAAHALTGNAGDVIYNRNVRMMQYCDGTQWIGVPIYTKAPNYQAYAMVYDDGYADFGGNGAFGTSGTKVTGSLWFRRRGNFGAAADFFNDTDLRHNGRVYFEAQLTAADKIRVLGENSSGTAVLDVTGSTVIQDSLWHHLLFSFDLTNNTATGRYIYLDDAAETLTVTTFTNANIDFANANAGTQTAVMWDGATHSHGYFGELSEIWIKTNGFIDLSVTANRRFFIDANKHPVNMGASGSSSGLTPDLWQSGSNTPYTWCNQLCGNAWHPPYAAADSPSGNPVTLTKLNTVTTSMSSTGEIAVNGNYAYVTDETNHTFNIINISTPSSMSVAGTLTDSTAFPNSAKTWGVAVDPDGNHAYVCGGGLITIDTSTKTAPTKAATLTDSRVCAGSLASNPPLAMRGKYLYTLDNGYPNSTFAIVDKSSPTSLSVVGSISGLQWGSSDNNIAIYGDYAYTSGPAGLYIIDISNPAAPYVVSLIADPKITQSVAVDPLHGNTVYGMQNINYDQLGFEDVTSKTAPVTGYARQTTGQGQQVVASGNRVYFTDQTAPPYIYVFDISSPLNPLPLTDSGNATCGSCEGIAVQGNYVFTTLATGGGVVSWQLTDGGTSCGSPQGNEGDVMYNKDYHVEQYCDGTAWQPLGPVPGAGGSGCAGPGSMGTVAEGGMFFNGDYRVPQYCDGTNWKPLGPAVYNPAPVAPSSGLVGWWKFDDGSGASAVDSSGGGNTGTLQNSPAWVTGISGDALQFSGAANMNVTVPSFTDNGTAVTYAYWIYPNSGQDSYTTIFQTSTSAAPTNGTSHQLNVAGAGANQLQITHWLGGSYAIVGTITVNVNAWNHIVEVVNGNASTVYLNGSVVLSASGTRGTANEPLTIGGDTTTSLGGSIDDFRVYGRTLSATEVANLYAATGGTFNSGLVAHWTFDESTGAVASDSSANGLSGTLVDDGGGLPTWEPTGGKIGGAVSLNGNNHVQVGDSPLLQLGGSFTVSGWANLSSLPPAGTVYPIISKNGSGEANTNYLLGVVNNDLYVTTVGWVLFTWNIGYGALSTGSLNMSLNTWYFVAGVVDTTANTTSLYVNGQLVASAVGTLAVNSSAGSPVRIGEWAEYNGGTPHFPGLLDDIRVYNRALSAGEISTLYSSATGGSCQ